MKACLRIFFIWILSCSAVYSQVERDNLWGMDFHLFGTSVHGAGRIGKNLFAGGEIGFLPDLFKWVVLAGRKFSKENTIWSSDKSEAHVNDVDQLLFAHAFTRWIPGKGLFELDAGLRWAVNTRSGYEVDDLGLTRFLGGYIKPVIGLDKLKVGVRVEFGDMKGSYYGPNHEFVIIASPLIRFNFR